MVLDRTYFYPTGGGQEHDIGQIASATVVEVQKSAGAEHTLHIVDRELPPGQVQASIDSDRRIRHMQHHTGQHLLSQCFLRLLGAATRSANINGYTPSTIDLDSGEISSSDLASVENLANEIIFKNLPVKSYFLTRAEVDQLPVRKPDLLHENIRVVEIEDFDFSACAGTHCAQTGSIGILKIARLERQNDGKRVHFLAGLQALEHYRQTFETVSSLSAGFSVHPRDLQALVLKQAQELQSARRQLASQHTSNLKMEALQLHHEGELIHGRQCILKAYQDKPAADLRFLATEFQHYVRTAAIFSSLSGNKLSFAAGCSPDSGLSASDLLRLLLQPFEARAGGDQAVAQGGGPGSRQLQDVIMAEAGRLLRSLPPLA